MFSKIANDDIIRICELTAAKELLWSNGLSKSEAEIDRMDASLDGEIEFLKARIPIEIDQQEAVDAQFRASIGSK